MAKLPKKVDKGVFIETNDTLSFLYLIFCRLVKRYRYRYPMIPPYEWVND